MYISIAPDTVVRAADIVGVFDIDKTSVGRDTKGFFKKAQQSGRVQVAAGDIPVSYVVLKDGRVILSPQSVATIKQRLN